MRAIIYLPICLSESIGLVCIGAERFCKMCVYLTCLGACMCCCKMQACYRAIWLGRIGSLLHPQVYNFTLQQPVVAPEVCHPLFQRTRCIPFVDVRSTQSTYMNTDLFLNYFHDLVVPSVTIGLIQALFINLFGLPPPRKLRRHPTTTTTTTTQTLNLCACFCSQLAWMDLCCRAFEDFVKGALEGQDSTQQQFWNLKTKWGHTMKVLLYACARTDAMGAVCGVICVIMPLDAPGMRQPACKPERSLQAMDKVVGLLDPEGEYFKNLS